VSCSSGFVLLINRLLLLDVPTPPKLLLLLLLVPLVTLALLLLLLSPRIGQFCAALRHSFAEEEIL